MSDLTQQALTALADAGLGNESAAEAFVLGYQAGYDAALTLAISIETHINSNEPTDEEIETCARGFFQGTPAPPTGTTAAKSPNRHGYTRPKRRSQPSTP